MPQVLSGGAVHDDHAAVAIAVGDERCVRFRIDPDTGRTAHQRGVVAALVLIHRADGEHVLAFTRELHHAVMHVCADPDEVVVIDEDAVWIARPLRHLLRPVAERAHHFALRIELQHCRRGLAAFAERRLLHEAELFFGKRLGQVRHPDVLPRVNIDAGHRTKNPVVGQFQWPRGIDLESRRRSRLRAQRALRRSCEEHGEDGESRRDEARVFAHRHTIAWRCIRPNRGIGNSSSRFRRGSLVRCADSAMTTKRGRPRRLRAAASSERFPSLTPQALHADGRQLTRQSKQLLRAQSELADARNRYAALYDLAPIGYLTLDHQGVIIEANLAAGFLCDQPRGYLIGLALMSVVKADDRDQLRLFTDQARIAAGGLVAADLTLNTRSRRTVRLLGRSVRTPEGLAQVLTAMIDVTAEKQLAADKAYAYEAEQRKSDDLASEVAQRIATEERVKALLERLVNVQEEERRRLALNLHDHLGQQLTALRLTLSTLRDARGDAERTRQFDAVEQIVSQLDRDVDFLAWELRPPALDDVGLEAALAEFVRQCSSATGVVAALHESAKGGPRLSPDIQSHLYRIVQEALNNVSKHAQASHVSVILERRVDETRVIIEDDGIGFQLADELMRIKRGSMGLTGIRERVALIGGDFELESAPGKGTTLFVRIPLHAAIAGETEPKDVDPGRR